MRRKGHAWIRASAIAVLGCWLAGSVSAMAPPVGIVAQPCLPAPVIPASLQQLLTQLFIEPRTLVAADFQRLMGDAEFRVFEQANRQQAAQDWAGLCRYREANARLAAGPATRVVFLGDSITENWGLADPALFSNGIVNRGISGQTTPQMLLRFRADVLSLRPTTVHILAGTNDVAGNTGPSSEQDYRDHIVSMVEMARAQGVHVVLGLVPPAETFTWAPALRPADVIDRLNAWLRDYGTRNAIPVVDYHAALAGPRRELRADLGNDGVHPNRNGYALMRQLVEPVLANAAASSRSTAQAGAAAWRAGAARVDVTPAKLPANFRGVLDRIYARAIVIENGQTRAALVSIDAGALRTDAFERIATQAGQLLGIPRAQLLVTATHTHSVPFTMGAETEAGIIEALRQAAARLQPARIGWGTGASFINVNRDRIDPQTRRWWEGPNRDGDTDRTVAVLRFETPAGKPIAVYYNYAVHAVLTGTLDLVSGDIPGAASRYIEDSLGGDAVALWSSGAAGDQNPVYFNQTYELREIRIADYATRGEDIRNAMPPGGQGMDRSKPRVKLLEQQQQQMTLSMGQMLGEEVLHVLRESLSAPLADATLRGATSELRCPGRRRTDSGRAGFPGTYVDAEDLTIRLGVLRLGDVQIAAVDGEVYSAIAQRLKRESPFARTMMATLTNGFAPTGYIPTDEAFGRHVFTVLSSRLKPGCAEAGIVGGLIELMR